MTSDSDHLLVARVVAAITDRTDAQGNALALAQPTSHPGLLLRGGPLPVYS